MSIENYSPKIEKQETLTYTLDVTLHRHGPKEGDSGPLSKEGREDSGEYYRENYEGVTVGTTEVVHSGLDRASETGEVFEREVDTLNELNSPQRDQRLSEGTISEHPELREEYGGKGGRWLKGWLNAEERVDGVKTGQEALGDLKSFITDKLEVAQEEGGSIEIDAFTHAPVMAALLLSLDRQFSTGFLSENWEEENIIHTKLPYLSTLTVRLESEHADEATVYFQGKSATVPRSFFTKYLSS
ncbi:MAG TPA: hypothetical protein VLA04_03530 [Verrucomicrobiae bacterium]|nr:hypothetical protein [Verrucomicrobiae bacterium]